MSQPAAPLVIERGSSPRGLLRIEFRFLILQFCYKILRDLEQVT